MAKTIADMDMFQQYINGVMERAADHAPEVEAVALAVAGAVTWLRQGKIRVWMRSGKMGNAMWVYIDGTIYFLAYHHTPGRDCCQAGEQGRTQDCSV